MRFLEIAGASGRKVIMRAMITTIRMMIVGPSMISNIITDKHNDDGDNESKSSNSTSKK